jgi:hypothetical protein
MPGFTPHPWQPLLKKFYWARFTIIPHFCLSLLILTRTQFITSIAITYVVKKHLKRTLFFTVETCCANIV